jgi:hypothetical protein
MLVSFGATNDERRDPNRPRVLRRSSWPAADACSAPFMCVADPEQSEESLCTVAWRMNANCPSWTASGQCPGPTRSETGICASDSRLLGFAMGLQILQVQSLWAGGVRG